MCDGDAARLALGLLEDMADDWEHAGHPTCPDPACGCTPADGGSEHAGGCRFAAFLRFRPLPRPAPRPRAASVQFFGIEPIDGTKPRGPRRRPGMMVVWLADGRRLSVPLRWFPRLAHGAEAELGRWELIARGTGIHWPLLDEDVSVEGLLAGRRSGECRASVGRWRKWLAARRSGDPPRRPASKSGGRR